MGIKGTILSASVCSGEQSLLFYFPGITSILATVIYLKLRWFGNIRTIIINQTFSWLLLLNWFYVCCGKYLLLTIT